MPELYGKFTGRPICRKEVSMKRSYGAPQEKAYRTRVLTNHDIYYQTLTFTINYYQQNLKNRPLFK